jgi:hypothetical protein
MCTYFLVCLLPIQYECYEFIVELVLFYTGDWGMCAAVWCSVSSIRL